MNGFVDAQGNPIADEQLGQAAQSGELRAIPGTKVHMLDAAGRPVTVDAEQAGAALGAGFVPEAASAVQARQRGKEFGTVGQQAITGLEGAARGLSFGLSDVALTGFGGDSYRRESLARQEVNPTIALGSELAGAVAPAIISGGASTELTGASMLTRGLTAVPRAATRLGRFATTGIQAESALARMAARAAEGAVAGAFEGMIYGAGSAAGGAALQGDQITAEKILSGGAHGGLIGGLLGGGIGAISGAASKRVAAAGEDMLLKSKLDKLDKTLRKQGLSEEKITERIARETAKLEKRSAFLDRVAADQAIGSLKPGPRVLGRHAKDVAEIDELVQQAGTDYLHYQMRTGPLAGKRIFHGAKDPVDALDSIQHAWQETDDILRAHKETATQTIAANPELAPRLPDLAARIDAEIGERLGQVELKTVARKMAPLQEGIIAQLRGQSGHELGALEATRRSLSDAIESATKPRELRALRTARSAVDDVLNEVTEGALARAGVDTTLFRQEARMHRSLSFVRDAAEELKVSQYSNRSGIENNAAGYALAAALSGNFLGALGVGATMFGQSILRNRAGGIVAELAHRVSRSDVRLSWGAKALSGDSFRYPVRSAAVKSLTGGAAERFYAALTNAAYDPKKQDEYVVKRTQDFAAQYPQLAAVAGQTIRGDLQYLAASIPARHSRGLATLTPVAAKPVGSKASADAFWEKVHALEDPGYVVDEMLSGRVPRAAIEALKARRPNEWARLRQAVAEECAARGEEIPFKRRINLGLAFDFTSDRSLMPGAAAAIQSTFAPKDQQGRPTEAGATKAQSGTIDSMLLSGEEL